MTQQLEWNEWSAIYLAGYNDARRTDKQPTLGDLNEAWEFYQNKRPMIKCRKCYMYRCALQCKAYECISILSWV